MITTLIVAGLDGSAAPHWQQWWAASDPHALMVELSDPGRPSPSVWEVELASMILQHPGCVLVGHSLGSILITRLLTQWPHLRVKAALLVAPAETGGADRIAHFGPIPERDLGVPALVAGSRNDPWMGFERAQALAGAWGAGFLDMGHAGHVNVASGYGPWPAARALRDGLRAEAEARAGFGDAFGAGDEAEDPAETPALRRSSSGVAYGPGILPFRARALRRIAAGLAVGRGARR
ncbi:RBBP9/YdeN family alpha/beta hydrolase [Pseudogemmobacter sonorensis]|uniref:RBBP9/YdeN family alpha/beta hydrolase n=1 Tax=Pseudogemmobacter sonorensis TaxID=2989681 RepID=UPI00369E5133